MHREAPDFNGPTMPFVSADKAPTYVVEFGSRNVNGSVRELVAATASYHGIDRVPGDGVDEVADAATWDSKPGWPIDLILCVETLEHAENAAMIVQNAYRRLKPRGLLLVTAASDPRAPHSSHDGGPLRAGEYYRNVDPDELGRWLAVFFDYQIEVDPVHGDVYAVAWKGE